MNRSPRRVTSAPQLLCMQPLRPVSVRKTSGLLTGRGAWGVAQPQQYAASRKAAFARADSPPPRRSVSRSGSRGRSYSRSYTRSSYSRSYSRSPSRGRR